MKIPLIPNILELFHDYYLCEYCLIVDKDSNRSRVGYECPRCKKESKRGRIYYNLNIFILLQLMQEFYHLERGDKDIMKRIKYNVQHNHKLAVVIFFCTLSEVLLNNFLKQYMSYNKIPDNVQERLFNDNLYPKQRVEKLFPSLTGVKWKNALKDISSQSDNNYLETFEFYLSVVNARNEFLHEGNKFNISDEMINQCMVITPQMVQLFVDLHNTYIAKSI